AQSVWRPFLDWVNGSPEDFTYWSTPRIITAPARNAWDPAFLKSHVPGAVLSDDRPGAPPENIFGSGNLSEVGHFLSGFQSLWLPLSCCSRSGGAHSPTRCSPPSGIGRSSCIYRRGWLAERRKRCPLPETPR